MDRLDADPGGDQRGDAGDHGLECTDLRTPEPQVFKAQQIAERGLGVGEELESPDIEGTDMEEPELEETLAAIADAVGTQLASLDDPTFTSRSRPGSGVKEAGAAVGLAWTRAASGRSAFRRGTRPTATRGSWIFSESSWQW